ncbi:hypothetical protein QBC46DRAFT_359267 [Diplogelasinospora grovesii]|uniref:Gfd2/YDR514C-like C-terminal domain-containing protein n=1 Tax=Diplogelasinospora grovesii TaxID=303347 RepID=A0AAN6MXH3_9PEZI|nr:hypothetical protein QBC46DRAFT_359267 [Diplogelasinospora grovesii]
MASSPFADLPRIKIPRSGGLNHLERILGLLQDSGPLCSSDALFVSIDLEVSRDERSKLLQSSDRPLVKEYGVAILDTRDIGGCTDGIGLHQLISTRHYSTRPLERPRRPNRVAIRECIFAHTNQVDPYELPSIIAQSLCVRDAKAPSPRTCFRNIAIVGHSVKHDLRILQRLGIDILGIAPLLVILDTHNMARDVLGPTSTRLGSRAPISSFTLAAVLAEIGCSYDEAELHNAGNDATYTLFALLGLAVRSSLARTLNDAESAKLEDLIRTTAPANRHRLSPSLGTA